MKGFFYFFLLSIFICIFYYFICVIVVLWYCVCGCCAFYFHILWGGHALLAWGQWPSFSSLSSISITNLIIIYIDPPRSIYLIPHMGQWRSCSSRAFSSSPSSHPNCFSSFCLLLLPTPFSTFPLPSHTTHTDTHSSLHSLFAFWQCFFHPTPPHTHCLPHPFAPKTGRIRTVGMGVTVMVFHLTFIYSCLSLSSLFSLSSHNTSSTPLSSQPKLFPLHIYTWFGFWLGSGSCMLVTSCPFTCHTIFDDGHLGEGEIALCLVICLSLLYQRRKEGEGRPHTWGKEGS